MEGHVQQLHLPFSDFSFLRERNSYWLVSALEIIFHTNYHEILLILINLNLNKLSIKIF